MNAISLTPQQFEQIVGVCERVMITTSTPAEQLRLYLALRMREEYPAIAQVLGKLDDDQFDALCQEIRKALYSDERVNRGSEGVTTLRRRP